MKKFYIIPRFLILSCLIFLLSACDAPTLEQVFKEKYGTQNFISIQVQRSNKYLNWKSPASVMSTLAQGSANSAVNNYSHVFGHATLVYGKNGVIKGYGETGDHKGEDMKALKNGFGFTAFTNFTFTDGHLERDAEVNGNNIDAVMEQNDKFAWITFIVDEEAVNRLEDYIAEFTAAKAYENYGFTENAKTFSGAVCTTFVNAALEASGLDIPLIDRWVRNITVPSKLMGYKASYIPEMEWARYTGPEREDKSVSILSIMTTFRWARPGEGETFILYDPELMYNACALLENIYKEESGMGNLKPLADNETDDALNLQAVVEDYYYNISDRITPGTLYETSGVDIDLRK